MVADDPPTPRVTRATAKRTVESPTPRSPRRSREATPVAGIDDPTLVNAEDSGQTELSTSQTEAKAGPSTRQVDAEATTSEAESVLFSEKTTVMPNDGIVIVDATARESHEGMDEYFMLEDNTTTRNSAVTTQGDQEFVPETTSSMAPLAVDDRIAMPPPSHTRPRRSTSINDPFTASTSDSGRPDRMTMVLEKQKKRSFAEIDLDESSPVAEDDEIMSDTSYHSGDSADFEMEHRPVLQRTAIKKDIKNFTASLELLTRGYTEAGMDIPYKVVDRLGEGTFSSVYLAHDCLHRVFDNEYWLGLPNLRTEADNQRQIRVALKKILVTSSAIRIENELAILENLRGCRNVSHLITAFREEDQVIIVLPYHQSDDFRHFFKHMDPPHIRSYMRDLLRSLKDIHKRGIIHRDVKPANFLYDYEHEHGVLVDFGLAERYVPPAEPTCQHAPATLTCLHGSKIKTAETPAVEQALYDARKRSRLGEGRVGFPQEDKRPAIRTNRAGTRGFRAPEVLLKCPDQTVALDLWSAGVILFSILTQKFPAFNSSDDIEALMEIAAIFGKTALERCALLHNRTIISNVPTLDHPPASITELILKLNPHLYTPHSPNPTFAEASEHIEAIDDALDLVTKLLRLDATKRLTAAQALNHTFIAGAMGEYGIEKEGEVLHPSEGKCGELHILEEGGRHQAYFHPVFQDLQFGQGVPPSRDSLCPEHEHYQDRWSFNPLVARGDMQKSLEGDREGASSGDEDVIVERPSLPRSASKREGDRTLKSVT